ncbi:hypothetical protein [Roseateles sp. PN1]|uniref:hypothetical protein n=1 Tax=Roseateles sp. PN1 TaxID=3137372 RepID=UPI003139A1AA
MSTKHLWEVDHPYYCAEGGYFHTQAHHKTINEYKSWSDFLASMADADLDMNLLFRWDWSEVNYDIEGEELPAFNGDVNYRNGRLSLFFMHQRNGFHSTGIVEVCRADEPAVIAYLQTRLNYLLKLWAPLELTEQPPADTKTADLFEGAKP